MRYRPARRSNATEGAMFGVLTTQIPIVQVVYQCDRISLAVATTSLSLSTVMTPSLDPNQRDDAVTRSHVSCLVLASLTLPSICNITPCSPFSSITLSPLTKRTFTSSSSCHPLNKQHPLLTSSRSSTLWPIIPNRQESTSPTVPSLPHLNSRILLRIFSNYSSNGRRPLKITATVTED